MPDFPFPTDPRLSAIAIGYRNGRMIADDVLPRVQVGQQEFKYLQYSAADTFTIPNTTVGRTSRPNEVEFAATEATGSTSDYGLEDPIPQKDLDNAPAGHDVRGQATEGLADLIELDREKRVADLVFAAASYPSGQKNDLSSAAFSTPISTIMDALDTPLMRPNVMICGRKSFTALATHPDIVKAVHMNSGDRGVASRQAIADLFELEEVLVGEAYYNSAKKGQAAAMSRLWGSHIALIHRDRQATNRSRASFGMTFQSGERVAGSWSDRDIGLRGGVRVRVGESVVEKITANALGYLFSNVAAFTPT